MGGGGGFGGGMGGGQGWVPTDGAAANDREKRLESETEADRWQVRTAVLTPGDRVEFKMKVTKGETILAGVTSDAFDPALAIVDAKGKELAKNDDREEGDQSPFLAYRFAEAGEYTVKVLSFRSVGGGKFTLRFRSFVSIDAKLGLTDYDVPTPSEDDPGDRLYYRLTAHKGTIYDLRHPRQLNGRSTVFSQLIQVVGPTGVSHNDFAMIQTQDNQPVFEAKADGDYYLEYNLSTGSRLRTEFCTVAVKQAKASDKQTLTLEPGELQLVDFPVKPNDIIRTTLTGGSVQTRLTAPMGHGNFIDQQASDEGTSASWSWFLPQQGVETDVVRIFHGTGTARLAIRNMGQRTENTVLQNSEGLPKWDAGSHLKGSLAIGESKLFTISSTKSELMRVYAAAQGFLAKLDIYRLNGERANSLSNRQTLKATDDLYFPDAGTFIVRLSCEGGGGSGAYEMERKLLTAEPYTLGQVRVMKLDGANFGLYDVNLEAGKRYELIYDLADSRYLRTDLLDDEGQFLTSTRLVFGSVVVEYFVPVKNGVQRLWLRGSPGSYKFRLSLHADPQVDGKG